MPTIIQHDPAGEFYKRKLAQEHLTVQKQKTNAALPFQGSRDFMF